MVALSAVSAGSCGSISERCGVSGPSTELTCVPVCWGLQACQWAYTLHLRHLRPYECYNINHSFIFLTVAVAIEVPPEKIEYFCDEKFYLRTYGFSRCLKKRSPWVGELFTFDWTDTILNNILFNLTEHILVRSPRLAIDSFLPGCGRWVQKFAHASISLPLNYTVAPC